MAKMARPCAWPSVAVLAGGGTRIMEVLEARCRARVGRADPFPRKCQVFTLHFDTADYIRYIQVPVLAPFLGLYASAKVGMSFDCKLNGAPKFDRGVIVETGVEAESGTTPQSRAGQLAAQRLSRSHNRQVLRGSQNTATSSADYYQYVDLFLSLKLCGRRQRRRQRRR